MRTKTSDRIVITGTGAVTPLGLTVEAYWQNLLAGKSGIREITRFDASDSPVKLAGEVFGFDPEDYGIPKKFADRMGLFTQFGCAAASQALAESTLQTDRRRIGVIVGTALSGTESATAEQRRVCEKQTNRVGSGFLTKVLANMAASQIALAHGLLGPSYTLCTACASGDDSVGLGSMLLQADMADAVLIVGCESAMDPVTLSCLASSRVMVTGTDITENRPFDLNRKGFVLGEGAGAIVLERSEAAVRRGAKIYGELLGYANNNDGYHITTPCPDGAGAARCMRLALDRAGLAPKDIGYISAHATGTIAGDRSECLAARTVFGKNMPPMSSYKGATGHMMAAGSVTDTITCLLAMRDGILPPTIHFRTPDPDCSVDCIPEKARKQKVSVVMNNAFGFGGQNASLIFGAFDRAD